MDDAAEVAFLEAQLAVVRRLADGCRNRDSLVGATVALYTELLDGLLVDVALEAHRAARLGGVDERSDDGASAAGGGAHTAATPSPAASADYARDVDVFGARHPPVPTDTLACPSCGRPVAAGRFAPHLEKCMGKGRAAARTAAKRAAADPTDVPLSHWSPPKKPPAPKKKAQPALAAVPVPQPWAETHGAPASGFVGDPATWAAAADAPSGAAGAAGGYAAPGSAGIGPRFGDVPPWQQAGRVGPPPLASPPPPRAPAAGAPGGPLRVRLQARAHGSSPLMSLPRLPPRAGGGGKSQDGRRRKELRAMLASQVALEDLREYAAAPPPPGAPPPTQAARAICDAAAIFKEMEAAAAAAALAAGDIAAAATATAAANESDVASVLRNMCSVVSQRSGTQGRLCSNGLACSNHRDDARAAVRAAVYGRDDGAGAWAMPPAEAPPMLHHDAPMPSAFSTGDGSGAMMFAVRGDSDADEALLLPSGAGGGALMGIADDALFMLC